MDLRSIINNDTTEAPPRQPNAPVTPVQATPPQTFRDFPPQGKLPSQEYASQTGRPYASPNPYHGGYPGRQPPPPPLQPSTDLRSPASFTAHSPFRSTPSSSASASTNQYPFPHQTPQSPRQALQYPSTYSPRPGPQSHLPHVAQSRISPAPQTPPIGLPGAAHAYLHQQRSQSSISSTPTSIQSGQYHPQIHDSPGAAHAAPPIPIHHRQQSQPGTPLGPPVTGLRQGSIVLSQKTSPYQQRAIPAAPHFQTSPALLPPPILPSGIASVNSLDSNPTSSNGTMGPQSVRQRTASVSPKTTVSEVVAQSGVPTLKRKLNDDSVEKVKESANGRTHQSASSSPQHPRKKRKRYSSPPIWARSVRDVQAGANRGMKKANGSPAPIKSEANGHRHVSPAVKQDGLLGPWEESITGQKPNEELSRVVADFLFLTVVSRKDLNELTSRGVDIEIEAKLGQLIDTETNQRYRLPVSTETILSARPGDTQFRSSMTEAQHKFINDFLNTQVKECHPDNPNQSKPRVPIKYKHRREVDTFYELPPGYLETLPLAVRKGTRHAKVRVTHDKKTNQVIAKIIKARVEDLDIYMPRQMLDCRISVNLEMRYDGDLDMLTPAAEETERSKDRLSYSQSQYQIDLTQVTQVLTVNKQQRTEKEHELEIEIETAALKEQGGRVAVGAENEYLKLVEGFLDNVRVLARAVPDAPR